VLIEERAARMLIAKKVQLCWIDGRVALVPPPDNSFVALAKRLLAAISGRRRPVDARAIVG